MALPGVKVGPMDPVDPEVTAGFGQVGKGNKARELIRAHSLLHPAGLRQTHGLPLNEERTKGLDLQEVRDGVDLPKGVAKGSEIVGAAVRGREGGNLVLCYVYLTPSGRTAKGWADYDQDVLPNSVEEGDRRVAVKDAKEAGLPYDDETSGPKDLHLGGARGQALERQNQKLKQQVDDLARQLTEVRQSRLTPAEGGREQPAELPSDEPFKGYDDLTADEVRARLKDADQATRDGVAEYEAKNKNRRSVLAAAHQR